MYAYFDFCVISYLCVCLQAHSYVSVLFCISTNSYVAAYVAMYIATVHRYIGSISSRVVSKDQITSATEVKYVD